MSSAENLLSTNNQSSPMSNNSTTTTTTTEIEEQVIQTESALQNEAEQRCTGK